MAKISPEELAALDQIAYQLAMQTYDIGSGQRTSDKAIQVDLYIDHFLYVRDQLIQGVMDSPHPTGDKAGTFGREK